MRKTLLLGVAMVMLAACGAATPTAAPAEQVGVTIDPPQPMPDFVLVNQDGDSATLASLRGKPLLFAFAYTHCPDICPLTVVDFKRVKKAMGAQGEQANFAIISVDGERDTPEVMKQYLSTFDDTFIGLTGAPGVVAQIAQPYGARFEAQKPSGTSAAYLVSHTSFMYLLDGYGRWRKTYAFQTTPEPIAADMQALLSEPAPSTSSESLTGFYANSKPQAIYMTSPVVMPDLTLTDQNGAPFTTASLRGHWALMYFGSTDCLRKDCPPDVLAQWGKVKQLLDSGGGNIADQLRFIMLSADPNHDTPAVLKAYLANYDKDFVALTGNKAYVAPIAVKYGVHIADLPDTQPPRYVPHSVYSVLLNPQGQWVVAFPFTMEPADMAAALKGVMK